MPVTKNKQSGFTLIELLIAVMLLAIGMLGLAELQVTAMKTNAQSASSTASRALAQRYVERIIAWDADDPRLVDGGSGTLESALAVEGAGTYAVTYLITQVTSDGTASGSPVSGLLQIEVEVTNNASSIGAFGRSSIVAKASALKRAT